MNAKAGGNGFDNQLYNQEDKS
jgi:hypothetical protein